jgi:hypothetical protein
MKKLPFSLHLLSGMVIIAVLFLFIWDSASPDEPLQAIGELQGELFSFFPLKEGKDSPLRNHDGAILKVISFDDLSPTEASIYIEDKLSSVLSLYDLSFSPYPDQLSKTIECEDRFIPQRKNAGDGVLLVGFASARLTYGACSDDLVAYRSLLFLHYCSSSRNLHQVEVFVPLSVNESIYMDKIVDVHC